MLHYVCNDVITAAAVFNFHRIEKVEREINRTNGVSDGQNEGEGREGVIIAKKFPFNRSKSRHTSVCGEVLKIVHYC